jgi:hypothetical protein
MKPRKITKNKADRKKILENATKIAAALNKNAK